MEFALLAIGVVIILLQVGLLAMNLKKGKNDSAAITPEDLAGAVNQIRDDSRQSKADLLGEMKSVRTETVQTVQQSVTTLGTGLREQGREQNDGQSKLLTEKIAGLSDSVTQRLEQFNKDFKTYTEAAQHAQETATRNVNETMEKMRADNQVQLDKMRQTVDEKLEKTLNDRINESFKTVSEQLSDVYKGLGEMKNLAGDVGDLKKVMSGVKTRGIFGEIQLGNIIREVLTVGQYEENVVTIPGSSERVEFAVCLPGMHEDEKCYLPIDSKFPGDTYTHLMEAYDSADKAAIDAARKQLEAIVKSEAKDIRDKYVAVPHTTRFGVMFLPTESLYAEVVSMGLSDTLQHDYNITVAGPTTLYALLNSLQMGFQTLAIQKRSGEIEKVLGAVKTEFGKFGDCLSAVQKKLTASSDELDKLVGTRTKMINSKLKTVTALPEAEASNYLPTDAAAVEALDVPEEG